MLSSYFKFLMPRPRFKGLGMRNLQYELSIYQKINNKATIIMSSYFDFCWLTRYIAMSCIDIRSTAIIVNGLNLGSLFALNLLLFLFSLLPTKYLSIFFILSYLYWIIVSYQCWHTTYLWIHSVTYRKKYTY